MFKISWPGAFASTFSFLSNLFFILLALDSFIWVLCTISFFAVASSRRWRKEKKFQEEINSWRWNFSSRCVLNESNILNELELLSRRQRTYLFLLRKERKCFQWMSNIDDVHQVFLLFLLFFELRLWSILKSRRRKSLSEIRLFAIIIVFSAENSIVIEFEIGEMEKNLQ